MSETGFNFEIKVDGVDKALTGTSQVAKQLEMLQQVLPGVGEVARRSFSRFRGVVEIASYAAQTLRREIVTLDNRVIKLGESATETSRRFESFGGTAAANQAKVTETVKKTTSAMRSLRREMEKADKGSAVSVKVDQEKDGQSKGQSRTAKLGSFGTREIKSFGDAAQQAYSQYVKSAEGAILVTEYLRSDLVNLKTRVRTIGKSASDVSRDFQAMAISGGDASSHLTKSFGSTSSALKGVAGDVQSLASALSKLGSNLKLDGTLNLKVNITAKMPKVIPVKVTLDPSSTVLMDAKFSNVSTMNIAQMVVHGNVPGAAKKSGNQLGRSGKPNEDPTSMIRQYVGVALASVASYGVVRSGFSGTVEEARFNNEWQAMTRELAGVFKPLMTAATDATRYVRKQLDSLDEGQQNLLMYGALGTVGAIGLHKMGLLGAVAKTSASGLATGGRGAATVAGAAVRGLGGVKAFTGIGTVLASGQMIVENAMMRRDTRRLERITNTPLAKLSGQERQALLKTGEDVENMTGEQRDGIRNEFINATRRQKERNLADQGLNPDGTRMGFFSRFKNNVGNLFGDIGIGGQERRQDAETRRGVLGLDAAAKRRFAMTGKGERNPFGDLNNITDEDMKKAANPEKRRVMLAQAGFGEAGGLREELQIEALKLAAVDPNEKKQEDANDKLIRVLEALDERLKKDNRPEEKPAPQNMMGQR